MIMDGFGAGVGGGSSEGADEDSAEMRPLSTEGDGSLLAIFQCGAK